MEAVQRGHRVSSQGRLTSPLSFPSIVSGLGMQRENNNSSLVPHCLILQGLHQHKCRITLDGNLDACSKRPTCDPGIYMLGSVLSNHELGHEYSLGGLFQAMASTGPPRRRHQVRCSLISSLWFIDI